jgi:predicted phosphodiesterase
MTHHNTKIATLATMSALLCLILSSCEKVSMSGVLIGGSGTNDRVEMSVAYYQNYMEDEIDATAPGDYSFIVGSDSHVAHDSCRIAEMCQIALDHGDMFIAHCGDIADTKAEYYIRLGKTLDAFKEKYVEKYFIDNGDGTYTDPEEPDIPAQTYEEIVTPFFVAVGNHDVTHNGWALFSELFHSSFFEFTVKVGDTDYYDHYIFLDSANGTLGSYQVDLLDSNMLMNPDQKIRHRFVFTHTNFFRPVTNEFSSTYAREELYYMLNKFSEWNCDIVFAGHVHKFDDREFGNVRYITLDSMSERNSPEPGDYLERVTCHTDGTLTVERVHMNYVAP